jgi:MYXO-CTERM domain-containing protein
MRLALVLVAALASPVLASPLTFPLHEVPSQHVTMVPHQTLYLNKCESGCDIKIGSPDANTNTTDVGSKPATFQMFAWNPGEWDAIVKCVQEVYSPYDITVTDQRPLGAFNENIVAGSPGDIGTDPGAGGIADYSPDCSPLLGAVSFTFAQAAADTFAQEDNNNRVWGVCWIIAQESAHAYGLPDHEYEFVDYNESTCSDPMTYRVDCGGEKFFRNKPAQCGEYANRACNCGGVQNSVAKLTKALGAGTSIIPAPTSMILGPAAGPVAAGFTVQVAAGSRRGVDHVELWLNGHNWATTPGAAFGNNGQPNPSSYSLTAPSNVPDGVIDVVAKAYDDLDIETDSATVTVMKGAACASAASCLTGQKCDAGKCYWDPPTGQLGDACTYNEFCATGMCQDSDIGQYCTQACVVNSDGACPLMYDCIATSDTQGVCLPQGKGSSGCCSVGPESPRALYAHVGLGLFVFGLVIRRRRKGSR